MTDFYIRFGALIKAARLRCNLSQQNASYLIEVSRPALAGWESARSRIPLGCALKLCRLYEIAWGEVEKLGE